MFMESLVFYVAQFVYGFKVSEMGASTQMSISLAFVTVQIEQVFLWINKVIKDNPYGSTSEIVQVMTYPGDSGKIPT